MNEPISGKFRSRQAKERIRRWLQSEGADYLTDLSLSPYRRAPYRNDVDFVVLDPVPFAIDVRVFGDPKYITELRRHEAKRWLAQRIALAERFGSFLPLFAASPTSEAVSDLSLPYVDAVLAIDALPSLHDVPNLVSLDPTTQEILKKGEPAKIEFMEEEEAIALWAKSLSAEEIVQAEGFPHDTIAERLRRSPPEEYADRRLDRALDAVIEDTIVGSFGGEFTEVWLPIPGTDDPRITQDAWAPRATLRLPAWQAPSDRRIVIRRYHVGENEAFLKAQELFAEARILLASGAVSEGSLLLLLSTDTVIRTSKKHSAKTTQLIDPYLVNVLEEGGWKVFPWDFAEREPAFIKYLREWND